MLPHSPMIQNAACLNTVLPYRNKLNPISTTCFQIFQTNNNLTFTVTSAVIFYILIYSGIPGRLIIVVGIFRSILLPLISTASIEGHTHLPRMQNNVPLQGSQ